MGIRRNIANLFKGLIKFIVYTALLPVGKKRRDMLFLELSQAMIPAKRLTLTGGQTIRFFCPSYDTLSRAEEFFVKEPETLRWIDSFQIGDVLWDVGANVGVYSIYAAHKGINVCAFEPSFANYWVLNKNIELNQLDSRVSAYCIAISEGVQLGSFNMGDTNIGGALYQFNKNQLREINYPGLGKANVVFNQAMISFSIDEFIKIFNPIFPSHIKIDIDGNERNLINGAVGTICDKRLKSVSIELDDGEVDDVKYISEIFKKEGFVLSNKEHAPQYDEGPSKNIYNYLYVRDNLT